MNIDKNTIEKQIKILINKETTNISEKEILIKYLDKINSNEYIYKVIEDLKLELCVPAMKRKLSKDVVKFYTEISRMTPGRRTFGSIFNMFIKKTTK